MERTFVMLKPDAVMRRLAGEIITRLERKGLRLAGMRMIKMSEKEARKLYKVHEGKAFYEGLVKFITSAPAVVMVVEGERAVAVVRNLLGKTFGFEASAGTIRGDFGMSAGFNLVHGSDAVESAKFEIPIFFKESDLISYEHPDHDWVYENGR